jgi:flagellar hook-associated protein 2
MGTITFSGLATGIDTSSIIDQLVAVERLPITRLEAREKAANTRISTLSDLSTKLKALKTAAQKLDLASELSPLAVKTSASTTVGISGTPSVAGSWQVNVTSLATMGSSKSRGFASADTVGLVSNGSLRINVGGDAPIDVAYSTSDSLSAIADRINSSGARASAAVVNDGTTSRLVISGTETGTANAVSFTDTGGLGMNDPGAVLSTATDAVLTVGGLPVTRSSNTVEGVIPGVTLDLGNVGTAMISSSRDDAAQSAAVKGFVDAYNAVQIVVGKQLVYSGSKKGEETLFGDSALQGLQRRMGGLSGNGYKFGADTTSLRDFGITLGNDGLMTMDATKFTTAAKANPSKLTSLFAGEGGAGGVAKALTDLASEYTDTGTGTLETKKAGLQSLVKGFQTQMDRIEDNATALGDRLRIQFSKLEALVSTLNAQASYISKIG